MVVHHAEGQRACAQGDFLAELDQSGVELVLDASRCLRAHEVVAQQHRIGFFLQLRRDLLVLMLCGMDSPLNLRCVCPEPVCASDRFSFKRKMQKTVRTWHSWYCCWPSC